MLAGLSVAFVLRLFSVSDSYLIQLIVKGMLFVLIFSAIVYMMIEETDRAFFSWFVKTKLLRRADM
jgi:hypothetical protein